jgi:hypothetical protein
LPAEAFLTTVAVVKEEAETDLPVVAQAETGGRKLEGGKWRLDGPSEAVLEDT